MMTDDEKMIFGKKVFSLEEMRGFVRGNATDILAVGFDVKKTFLFSDFDFMGGAFYQNVVKISRQITQNTSKAVFGFTDRWDMMNPQRPLLFTDTPQVIALVNTTTSLSSRPRLSLPPSRTYLAPTRRK
jgi:tryptophanyl-tRNA synthetase